MSSASLHIIHPNLATSTRMRRWLHLVAGFLLLLFTFQLFRETGSVNFNFYFVLFVVALCFVAASFHTQKIFSHPVVNITIRFLCSLTFVAIGWHSYKTGNQLFALLFLISGFAYLMLGLTERYILSDNQVLAGSDGLQVPGTLRSVLFPWIRIRDVIHRDGWLTILFTNNRYLQFELDSNNSTESIAEFLGFCHKKVMKP